MTALSKEFSKSFPNPLDMIEQIAASHDWLFERSSESDLAVEVTGHWCDYRMFVSWHPDVQALLFACAFDMRVPEKKPAFQFVIWGGKSPEDAMAAAILETAGEA